MEREKRIYLSVSWRSATIKSYKKLNKANYSTHQKLKRFMLISYKYIWPGSMLIRLS